jgi:hypothetical protein
VAGSPRSDDDKAGPPLAGLSCSCWVLPKPIEKSSRGQKTPYYNRPTRDGLRWHFVLRAIGKRSRKDRTAGCEKVVGIRFALDSSLEGDGFDLSVEGRTAINPAIMPFLPLYLGTKPEYGPLLNGGREMARPASNLHLQPKNGGWRARVLVPVGLQGILGKKLFHTPVWRVTKSEAAVLAYPEVQKFEALIGCEFLEPNYMHKPGRQGRIRTSDHIADDLISRLTNPSDPRIGNDRLLAAQEFKRLVKVRNSIFHGQPGSTPTGEHRLFREGIPWTPETVDNAVAEFEACSHILRAYHDHLRT